MKVKAEKLSSYPIWRIYNSVGKEVDFYWRKTDKQNGLTKEEVTEVIKNKYNDLI
jgi:hypothetical protein